MPNQPNGKGLVNWSTLVSGSDGTNGVPIKVDSDGNLQVEVLAGTANIGDVDVLSIVPGTGALNLGKAEDALHVSGDVGVMALGVRRDTNSADMANADGDYSPLATDFYGNVRVTGGTPLDVTLVNGTPVAIGGRASAAVPNTVSADGDAVWAWLTRQGAVVIGAYNTGAAQVENIYTGGKASLDVESANPTGVVATMFGVVGRTGTTTRAASAGDTDGVGGEAILEAVSGLYNGTTIDRARSNVSGTLLASAARTATVSSADQTNYNGQAVAVTLNVTVVPGAETLTLTIEAKDPVSGAYTTILTGAARSTTGTDRLRVGTNITAVANLAAADVLGRTWRATVTHSAAGSFTYSLGYDVMAA